MVHTESASSIFFTLSSVQQITDTILAFSILSIGKSAFSNNKIPKNQLTNLQFLPPKTWCEMLKILLG